MKWLRLGLIGAVLWRVFGPRLQPEFQPPQEHPLRVPGHTVFVGDDEYLVREMGPDKGVPLLLIHGLAGSSLTEWFQVAPKLAVERRLIMVDNKGHGLSPKGDARYEIEEAADDIVGVLDALGVGQVDVAGYSMGGLIAQALAHRHPGRVRRLALLATFATHSEGERWLRRVGTVVARGWERVMGVGTPEVRSGYLIVRHAVEPRHARWVWQETARRDIESGAQATFALLRFDSTEWVGKLGMPTLVMVPPRDFLVPPRWQYELAAMIPDSEVAEVKGAGHEMVWTHADEIADKLRDFFSR